VTRFCSIFNQLLQLFPRYEFQKAVLETKAERHARGFACWDQFIAMLFCQLADAASLREICGGLASGEGRLAHVGARVPARATLAYANRHRCWQLFETIFYQLLNRVQMHAPAKTKFRFKNKLLSLDGTHLGLCMELYPWARYSRRKGAIKLHMTLDHQGYLPTMMVITTGKQSELAVARRQHYEPGTILTFDRGYIDFEWFHRLNDGGVLFVTRLKSVARYEVIEERKVPEHRGVLSDRVVRFTARRTQRRYPNLLRLVTIRTEEGEELTFLTNHLKLGASTVALVYKDRWQIESFFKTLKQNLRIKTFIGTSANSVWIQVWTALIAMLLLKYLQLKARSNWSFSNLVYFVRMNLFVYRDLWEWLNEPYIPPPVATSVVQAVLTFN
jgi:Transposase DDE domain/Domain of unknown function (DUF4372)